MECLYNSVMYDVVHFTMLHVSTAPLSLSICTLREAYQSLVEAISLHQK